MRADTKKKHEMGKGFAILIGVAAACVMALGAQTALAGGESVDSTPPDLQLSGPMKQSPQNVPRNCPPPGSSNCDPCLAPGHPCSVEVRVSHTGEAFTVRATGKLTNVKMAKLAPDGISVGPVPTGTKGNKPKVGPMLAKYAQRKQVRQALDEGKNVQAKVTLKATDAAGNVATAKRTITLVK